MQQTNHSNTSGPSEVSAAFRFLSIQHRTDEGAPVALALEFAAADDPSDCPAGSLFLYDEGSPFPSIVPLRALKQQGGTFWQLIAAKFITTGWAPYGLYQDSRYWAADDGPKMLPLLEGPKPAEVFERGPFAAFLLRQCPDLQTLLSLEPCGVVKDSLSADLESAAAALKDAARWQWLTLCTGDPDRARQESAEPRKIGPYLFTGNIGQTSPVPPAPKRGGAFEWAEGEPKEGLRGTDCSESGEVDRALRGMARDKEAQASQQGQAGADDAE